jgi:hypothetical protein
MCVRSKTRSQAVPDGVGDEYATSVAANPVDDQSAHRCPANSNRRRSKRRAPESVFCHAARGRAERRGRPPPVPPRGRPGSRHRMLGLQHFIEEKQIGQHGTKVDRGVEVVDKLRAD